MDFEFMDLNTAARWGPMGVTVGNQQQEKFNYQKKEKKQNLFKHEKEEELNVF